VVVVSVSVVVVEVSESEDLLSFFAHPTRIKKNDNKIMIPIFKVFISTPSFHDLKKFIDCIIKIFSIIKRNLLKFSI